MNGTLTLGIWVAAHTISLAVVIIKIIVINKGNKWKEVRYRKNNEL
jgi:hypothetical protein